CLGGGLLAARFAALPGSEAPTGFDSQGNGMVDEATHQADQVKFDELENVTDGLGPLYNAQSCRECTLVNDRAICPNGAFPNTEIQERLPDSENVRTTRLSLSVLGDGFVEAVADQTFIELARKQCKETHHKICG